MVGGKAIPWGVTQPYVEGGSSWEAQWMWRGQGEVHWKDTEEKAGMHQRVQRGQWGWSTETAA